MVPLIENEIVTKRNWIAKDDFIDLLAIAQSSPGILAVNISIFIGYRLRGIRGSIITALGTILPSFLIILAIALFFHNFKENTVVERIFKGIRPAVVALIAAPTFSMGKSASRPSGSSSPRVWEATHGENTKAAQADNTNNQPLKNTSEL